MSRTIKLAMMNIHKEMLDQVCKERDIAIQQLEELGTCIGEKTAIARRRIAKQAVKEDREYIREEIRQAIENGVIKIETGSEKLFELLN